MKERPFKTLGTSIIYCQIPLIENEYLNIWQPIFWLQTCSLINDASLYVSPSVWNSFGETWLVTAGHVSIYIHIYVKKLGIYFILNHIQFFFFLRLLNSFSIIYFVLHNYESCVPCFKYILILITIFLGKFEEAKEHFKQALQSLEKSKLNAVSVFN